MSVHAQLDAARGWCERCSAGPVHITATAHRQRPPAPPHQEWLHAKYILRFRLALIMVIKNPLCPHHFLGWLSTLTQGHVLKLKALFVRSSSYCHFRV
jgi:hypothetical protein